MAATVVAVIVFKHLFLLSLLSVNVNANRAFSFGTGYVSPSDLDFILSVSYVLLSDLLIANLVGLLQQEHQKKQLLMSYLSLLAYRFLEILLQIVLLLRFVSMF